MVQSFLPLHYKNIGLSDSLIGFIIGVFAVSFFLLVIPVGLLSDRLRIENLARIGIVFYVIYCVGLLWVENIYLLIFFTCVGGVGSATTTVSLTTIFYKQFSSYSRGGNIGLFSLGNAAGYSLGPLAAGLLMPSYGMYGVLKATILLFSLLFIVSFQIKLKNHSIKKLSSLPTLSKYFKLSREPDILLLFICTVIFANHLGMEQVTITLFLEDSLHQSFGSIGSLYALLGIWVGFNSFVLGRMYDHHKKIFPFLLYGTFCSGVFQVLTVFTKDYGGFLTIRLFHTLGDAAVILINGVMISLIFKNKSMGEGIGTVMGLRMLTVFISATFSGLLSDFFGYRINFLTTGIISLLFCLYVFINRKKVRLAYEKHTI